MNRSDAQTWVDAWDRQLAVSVNENRGDRKAAVLALAKTNPGLHGNYLHAVQVLARHGVVTKAKRIQRTFTPQAKAGAVLGYASQRFQDAVDDLVNDGLTKQQAIVKIVHDDPGLHQAMLAEANQGRQHAATWRGY